MITEKTITVVEVDWDALAAAVEKRIMEKLQYDLVAWKDDKVSMRAMVVSDAGAGLDVCAAMLKHRDWAKVEEKLWHMDTAPREYVYNYIEEAAGPKFVEHFMR